MLKGMRRLTCHLIMIHITEVPTPVGARSKAWVCGRLLAVSVGSNPTAGMNVCRECCVLSGRGLCVGLITCPEDSRVWRVWVWSSSLDNETLARWGLLNHGKRNNWSLFPCVASTLLIIYMFGRCIALSCVWIWSELLLLWNSVYTALILPSSILGYFLCHTVYTATPCLGLPTAAY
jgi:hypothetical protein